jgi:hypothetical protein
MTHDEAITWAKRVTEYFGAGKYTDEQFLDVSKFMRSLDGLDAERLYTKLKELNRTTYKIDLKALYEASNELGIRRFTESRESNELMAGKRVPCSMCGEEFVFNRYAPCFDPRGGPVSACPVCGWNERQTLLWREAGSPQPDDNGYGANYARWFGAYEANLAEHKRTTLSARKSDEHEARKSIVPQKPVPWTTKPRAAAEKIYS